MLQTLTASQAIESMVEHARANLQLQEPKQHDSKGLMIITGRGILDRDFDVPFAFGLVTKTNRALSVSYFNRKITSSSAAGTTSIGIILPRSIDYETAAVELGTPYLKQAQLLPEWMDPKLRAKYARFEQYDVKDLSRLEMELAIPLSGYQVAYYNPLHGTIEVCSIMKFPKSKIIPDNRPREERADEQGYFWDFIEAGVFPNPDDFSRKADVFRGIQEGLNDRVRRIVDTKTIRGGFTLTRYTSKDTPNGARVVKYP